MEPTPLLQLPAVVISVWEHIYILYNNYYDQFDRFYLAFLNPDVANESQF
jgi:hypothetical protein